MTFAQLANTISGHLAQVGLAALAVNTAFQKLPVQEQNDLIGVAWKGVKWVWSGIVSMLTQSQKKALEQTVGELKKRVAELESQSEQTKPQATAPAPPTLVQGK